MEPKSSGDAPPGGADAATLARIDELEHNYKHVTKTIDFVADTNRFIIVVLFTAFLVIIIAVGVAVITTNK